MKKIFSILAIAALVSCNSAGETSEVKPVDSPAVTAPATDAVTAPVTDTTAMAKPDTTGAAK
jgi:hypothetical protein